MIFDADWSHDAHVYIMKSVSRWPRMYTCTSHLNSFLQTWSHWDSFTKRVQVVSALKAWHYLKSCVFVGCFFEVLRAFFIFVRFWHQIACVVSLHHCLTCQFFPMSGPTRRPIGLRLLLNNAIIHTQQDSFTISNWFFQTCSAEVDCIFQPQMVFFTSVLFLLNDHLLQMSPLGQ